MEGAAGGLPRDPLAVALLPVLMHRLNNATQLLQTLGSLAALDGERDWIGERGEDLAETSCRVEELGYVLAVIASAGGADLLQQRREPGGLALLVAAADDALRREGRRLAPATGPLPELAPDAGNGWEAPWAAASFLLAAGRDGPVEGLAWALGPTEADAPSLLRAEVVPGSALAALGPLLASRAGELRLRLEEGSAQLELPAGWLRFLPAP